jgi:uncharacterized protein
MIVEFKVRNFRSLRDEQTLSFVASNDHAHEATHCLETGLKNVPRLTRSAVIYGANASGKSNLIFALATMRNLVLHSTAMSEPVFAEQYTPFRLDRATAGEPMEFEVVALIDGVRYQYGVACDAMRIRGEWLTVYKTGKGQAWFDRKWDVAKGEYDWAPFSNYFTGPKEVWKQATRPGALFLTTAVQLNNEQLKPLWDWFTSGVSVLTWPGAMGVGQTLQKLDDPAFKARALKLLRAADIHISDIEVEKHPGQQVEFKLEPGKPPEFAARDQEIPVVKFWHRVEGEEPVAFDGRYESAGTQRLLSYIGPLLDAIETGKLLVIDEIDSSLHPMVVRFVLQLLHDPIVSQRGAQFWITTHDTSLLDTDLLRRDQIWFVDKNERQASRLYPLTEFGPRKNEALEKAYLRARYGGVPFISRTDPTSPRFQ